MHVLIIPQAAYPNHSYGGRALQYCTSPSLLPRESTSVSSSVGWSPSRTTRYSAVLALWLTGALPANAASTLMPTSLSRLALALTLSSPDPLCAPRRPPFLSCAFPTSLPSLPVSPFRGPPPDVNSFLPLPPSHVSLYYSCGSLRYRRRPSPPRPGFKPDSPLANHRPFRHLASWSLFGPQNLYPIRPSISRSRPLSWRSDSPTPHSTTTAQGGRLLRRHISTLLLLLLRTHLVASTDFVFAQLRFEHRVRIARLAPSFWRRRFLQAVAYTDRSPSDTQTSREYLSESTLATPLLSPASRSRTPVLDRVSITLQRTDNYPLHHTRGEHLAPCRHPRRPIQLAL